MDRRKFVKTGVLGTMSLLNQGAFLNENLASYKLGYQLFSIRDRMQEDAISTLKALKAVGYEDFEVYGYDEASNKIYGYTPTEFKGILDDLGLTVSSGHYGFSDYLHKSDDEVSYFVDQCIQAAKAMDTSYITWPWLDPKYRTLDNFRLMSDKLNKIGEQVYKSGLGFAYHNHGFEFEKEDGICGYDIILKETDPSLVKLQLDMYWLIHSSDLSPKDIVETHTGRVVMWHIKDMHKVSRDYTELGNGTIDYLSMLPQFDQSGLDHYFIEQGGNFTVNSKESAKFSMNYFKEHLQKFL